MSICVCIVTDIAYVQKMNLTNISYIYNWKKIIFKISFDWFSIPICTIHNLSDLLSLEVHLEVSDIFHMKTCIVTNPRLKNKWLTCVLLRISWENGGGVGLLHSLNSKTSKIAFHLFCFHQFWYPFAVALLLLLTPF